MKAYELLYANRTALEMMSEVAVEVSDVKYLEMYKEYLLSNKGRITKRRMSCNIFLTNMV